MKWNLVFAHNGKPFINRDFATLREANSALERLGSGVANLLVAHATDVSPKLKRMINEGLLRNDLEGILLPKVSVDDYLPADQNTDNIVVAFFIKGVPEAVLPFKQFCEKCNGVLKVDYSDAETVDHASIIYVEFDRQNFDINDMNDLMYQVGLVAGFDHSDFQITFPVSAKAFPYSREIVQTYFAHRNREDNMAAQQQAIKDRTDDIQKDVNKAQQAGVVSQGKKPAAPSNTHQNPFAKPEEHGGEDIRADMVGMISAAARKTQFKHTGDKDAFDQKWAAHLQVPASRIAQIRRDATRHNESQQESLVNMLVERAFPSY